MLEEVSTVGKTRKIQSTRGGVHLGQEGSSCIVVGEQGYAVVPVRFSQDRVELLPLLI